MDAGYLNPLDQSHARVYQIIYPDMEGKGYVQTQWWESVVKKTGITHESKLPMLQEKMERFANDNDVKIGDTLSLKLGDELFEQYFARASGCGGI